MCNKPSSMPVTVSGSSQVCQVMGVTRLRNAWRNISQWPVTGWVFNGPPLVPANPQTYPQLWRTATTHFRVNRQEVVSPTRKVLASDAELYEAAHRRIKNDKTSLTTNLSLINEGAVAILLLTLWRLKIRVVVMLITTPVLGRETNQCREWPLGHGRWHDRHPGRSRSFDKAHDHS